MRGAFKQVEVIFDVQWPFVKAVAADLLTRETLTYEEVEAIRMRGDVDQRVQRLLLRRLKAADREMKRQVARMMREGKWD